MSIYCGAEKLMRSEEEKNPMSVPKVGVVRNENPAWVLRMLESRLVAGD
jgi:hypothetical protein